MALLEILTWPNERLRKTAKPVTDWSPDLTTFILDMFETMYADQGVGLAATQVGVQKRIIVVDCGEDEPAPLVFINPHIVYENGQTTFAEGCLSIPGLKAEVDRSERIVVRYQTQLGTKAEMSADGLLAICIQHEIDHLNGLLYFDHLPEFERRAFLQSYSDLSAEAES
jgi:peptide deformylase